MTGALLAVAYLEVFCATGGAGRSEVAPKNVGALPTCGIYPTYPTPMVRVQSRNPEFECTLFCSAFLTLRRVASTAFKVVQCVYFPFVVTPSALENDVPKLSTRR